MDAIKLLKQQHRLVEKLFEQFDASEDDAKQEEIFLSIADNLAVHATIEERYFYPAVRARQTEENVEEAYDEHLEIKKLILDAMRSTEEPGFDGKVAALKGAVEHHVEEEESELFPKVQKLFEKDALEAIGQQMEAESEQLMSAGAPRKNVKVESEAPAAQP
jgi:hemerythrin superfamily protein